MEKYTKAQMEVIEFEAEDVIAPSIQIDPDGVITGPTLGD